MTNALHLENWTVLAVSHPEGHPPKIVFEATFDAMPEGCTKCGVVGELYRHGSKVVPYRDVPFLGKQSTIFVTRLRFRCRACGSTFMQELPDMDDDRRMTNRCRDYIAAQSLLRPNTHVADDVGVDEKIVRQISKERNDLLDLRRAATIEAPEILGIDELMLGDEVRAIFVDGKTSWPIELLSTRWQGPVAHFLYNLPGRERVRIVTIDMWKPYKVACQAALPNATIIVDKWHVMRMANDAMETARRRYQGLLSAGDRKAMKANRLVFLKRPYQLTPKEQLDIDGWLKNTPGLEGAYQAKEAFMDIWRAKTREEAKAALDAWRSSLPVNLAPLFRPVLISTKNWEPEILNYFDHGRYTNAPTEARNRVIKMINRLGAGYSFKAIRARALFGKRPGRVAQELGAAPAKATPTLAKCDSCKGLFKAELLENANQWKTYGPSRPKRLCPDCHWRLHTGRPKRKRVSSTWKSE